MKLNIVMVGVLAVAAGCATDDGTAGDDPATGQTEQAVSSDVFGYYTCRNAAQSAAYDCQWNVSGPLSYCILSGVSGNLRGLSVIGDFASVGGNYNYAAISLAGTTGPVTADLACVSIHDEVVVMGADSADPSNPAANAPADNPNRRCYLTGIQGQDGAFGHAGDGATITQRRDGSWHLSAHTTTGSLHAWAVCLNVTSWGPDQAWSQSSGVNSGIVGTNTPGGMACGLTDLEGVFDASDTDNGVTMRYLSPYWDWTFLGNHRAITECFR